MEVWRTAMKGLELEVCVRVLQADKRTVSRIHVVSCYALTKAPSREDKDAFSSSLTTSSPEY